MADEPVVAPAEQDTPEVEAASAVQETPAQEQQAPQTDWEKRYNDLRPEFDRSNQMLAAARGDHGPEAQAEALRQFGIELEQDEPDYVEDEFADPMEEVRRLREEITQKEAAQQEAAEAAEFDKLENEYISKTTEELEKQHGIKLTEKEKRIVRNDALANRLDDDRPDLEGAFADLIEVHNEAVNRRVNAKTNAPKAPVGTAGEDKLDLSDDETRQKFMAEVFEAEGGFDENP